MVPQEAIQVLYECAGWLVCCRRNRLVEEFSRFEVDDEGCISLEDLQTMLADQGCSQTMVQQLAASCSDTRPGKVNFEEFKRFLNFT